MTKQPQQAGFTLIECLACIVILGTAVVAGVSLAGVHSQVVAADETNILATRFLQREVEVLASTEYDSIANEDPVTVAEDTRFKVFRTVVENATCKEITISVTWTSQSGVTRTESLTTLRCLNEID